MAIVLLYNGIVCAHATISEALLITVSPAKKTHSNKGISYQLYRYWGTAVQYSNQCKMIAYTNLLPDLPSVSSIIITIACTSVFTVHIEKRLPKFQSLLWCVVVWYKSNLPNISLVYTWLHIEFTHISQVYTWLHVEFAQISQVYTWLHVEFTHFSQVYTW